MQSAVSIKNLTKMYKLYSSPLWRVWDALTKKKHYDEFYALKNVNAEFPKGEVIAILGRNGSGKSTLLKIITGVTRQTKGSVKVNGRIAAMLELTSGFDLELTGIENIFLKGVSMGFSRKEIEDRLQEIIDFADIGEHINSPVRTYSSGMRARLGFAISVNVDPDILLVDEVLAVGDDVFRLKCIERMREFRQQGKTILFVSHSLGTIKAFCTKAMWLHEGKVIDYGDLGDVVVQYENFLKQEKAKLKEQNEELYEIVSPRDLFDVRNVVIKDANGKKTNTFNVGEDIHISLTYTVKVDIQLINFGFSVYDAGKNLLYSSDKRDEGKTLNSEIGDHKLSFTISTDSLIEGRYYISGELWDGDSTIHVTFLRRRSVNIKQDSYRGSGVVFIPHEHTNS